MTSQTEKWGEEWLCNLIEVTQGEPGSLVSMLTFLTLRVTSMFSSFCSSYICRQPLRKRTAVPCGLAAASARVPVSIRSSNTYLLTTVELPLITEL